jgi:mono/diheme cytochrome c family protein
MSRVQQLAIIGGALIASAFFAMTRATQITQAAARTDDSPQTLAHGKELYDTRCGICHEPGGTGAIMLSRRLGKDRAILATRTDLTSDYIHKIVRVGIGSMPPFSRIEVTNSELDLIAAYLTRPAAGRTPSADQTPRKSPSSGAHE